MSSSAHHVAYFPLEDLPTAEVDRLEEVYAGLAGAVRDLVDVTLSTAATEELLEEARAAVDSVTAALRVRQSEGPLGVRHNGHGRTWSWGNAVIGPRNATAPPLEVVGPDEDGRVTAEVVLGPAHQDEPGVLHPGAAVKLLDHLMGVTAADRRRLTMTGTLRIAHHRPTPLGPVSLAGWISGEEGSKVFVHAELSAADGVTVEADGVFVIPRWARD
ncbi:PaaI family thioesterase [Nocardioides sp. W7]|uniref:PaaI family thioesterase n=1 Tax=Nocardioides sp. W7 TaxID=2931390 RepID=UPI001FD5E945|nr:PaaI family thioesterase [Nocardioides sp. W7]